MIHPKTDVMISGLKKQNTPSTLVPKQGIGLFFTVFSFAALLSLLLSRRHSLHAFRLPAHKLPEAKSSESSSPLSTCTRADRTTVIHCYFGPRAAWSVSERGHIGIFCGSRGCFQSQITLPDHWRRMNSLPSLPTRHNGCGSLSAEPNSREGPPVVGIAYHICCILVARNATMYL